MSISETVFSVIAVETVAASGTSVSSGAAPDGTEAVRIVAGAPIFAKFSPREGAGTAVTAASTTGFYIPAETPEYFKLRPGQKTAVIRDASDSNVRLAYLARQ